MKIISHVPASDKEAILKESFKFMVENELFEIEPMNTVKYMKTETMFNQSIVSIIYYRAGWDKILAKELNVEKKGMKAIKNATTFTKILATLIEPNHPAKIVEHRKRIKSILKNHNRKYRFKPKLWCFNIAKWFELYSNMDELFQIASYVCRYMGEKKNLLLSILQKEGIGGLTKEKEDSLPSHEQQLMRAVLDPSSRQNHSIESYVS